MLKSRSYPIPAAALDDRFGWLGTSGSGKTYNAGGGVERLLQSDARVVIVDPLGVWWGLRLLADGKTPSPFNVVIFGGPHGDLPLNEHVGAVIGETAATMAESCIIDLSEFGSKAADRRFMVAFLESLYRKAGGDPFHLVVDEADLFAPQKPGKGDEVLLGHMENIVRRGRVKGFIPWLISQRPAVLNKNVLSQVDGLVAFMLTASHDRNALDAWIEGQADPGQGKQIKDELPTLPVGTGVVWLPRRSMLETVAFPPKITFDSSRTPKRGEKKQRRALKPLDLGSLKEKLVTVEAEAKANDPKALRAEVTRLKQELSKQKPQVVRASAEELANARAEGRAEGFHEAIAKAVDTLAGMAWSTSTPTVVVENAKRGPKPTKSLAAPPSVPVREHRHDTGLRPAHQKVVDALAWWAAAGFPQVERRRACIMAGYSPKASTFGVYISELVREGLVEAPEPTYLRLTDAGSAVANAPDMTSDGAVLDAARALLSPAETKLFDELVEDYPEWVSRGDLADRVGLSRTASTLGVYLSKIGSFGFTEVKPSYVRLADWLFPAGGAK